MKQQRVSDLGKRLADPEKYRAALLGAGYQAAMLEPVDNVCGTQGTGNSEWFTPEKYFPYVRSVLGAIDLDPASDDEAQRVVCATRYFTKADDGLAQEWHGRVWLNPPYGPPLISQFTRKMVDERLAGRITAGIMLTHAYTSSAWFHKAALVADAICFTLGRVRFYAPDGRIAGCAQGQAFFYYGDSVLRFTEKFRPLGLVYPRPMCQ
jgi:phage N-6-adenine-methyltransferase